MNRVERKKKRVARLLAWLLPAQTLICGTCLAAEGGTVVSSGTDVARKGATGTTGPPAGEGSLPVARGLGADVVATVTAAEPVYDPVSGKWTYSYTVSNDPTSPRGIWGFSLEPIPRTAQVAAPPGWEAGWIAEGAVLNWFAVDPGPNPPENNGNVSPSPFDIAPGAAKTFAIAVADPPIAGATTFYVHGFHEWEAPTSPTEEYVMLTTQPCVFEDAYVGTTTGPYVTVNIEQSPVDEEGLLPPMPNPVQVSAVLRFTVVRHSHAVVVIYDVAGRQVGLAFNQDVPPGTHSVIWEARDASGRWVRPGHYFCQLWVDNRKVGTRRLLVLK